MKCSALILGLSAFSALLYTHNALNSVDAPVINEAAMNAKKVQLAAAIPATPAYPKKLDLIVASGDTLAGLLTDQGVAYSEAQELISALKKEHDPRKLTIGKTISLSLDKVDSDQSPKITALKMPISVTSNVEVTRNANDFKVKTVEVPVSRKLVRGGGKISSSLYQTAVGSGVPSALLGDLIQAYSYDVDFQRDVKSGDTIDVLFERMETKQGQQAGYGNLLYAELDLGDRVIKLYRFKDASGNVGYYNEKGESIRKALLKTPINGAKITSGFGMRNHPILGYSKMHKGVDFAAPIGTPVYAAGDGTVKFAGRKGGYGNYLQIGHNGQYSSAYGHLSRFASGITPGKRVKQGQIVAYVGTTGMSTGPHLHYEILVANQQVNPAGVKFKTGNTLAGKELAQFKQNVTQVVAQLQNAQSAATRVAALDNGKKNSAN